MRVVRITCDPEKRLERVPLVDLQDFQGNLKQMSDESSRRMREAILRHGYSFPTAIWHGRRLILDGHQRTKILRALVDDGYQLVDVDGMPTDSVPVVQVVAETESEAREKLLAAVSQYGQIDTDGMVEFLQVGMLEWPNVKGWVDFPDFDAVGFERMVVPATDALEPPDNFQEVDENLPTDFKCPKCGYEWSGGYGQER